MAGRELCELEDALAVCKGGVEEAAVLCGGHREGSELELVPRFRGDEERTRDSHAPAGRSRDPTLAAPRP